MSLLGKMFQKSPSHEEKVTLAYKCYRPELVGTMFPGGKQQAEKIIVSLAKIYNKDLGSLDAKQYHEILSTYSDVVIRKVITQSTDEHIQISLQVNHNGLVTSKEIARNVLAFVTLNMNNHDFALTDDAAMSTLELMSDAMIQMEAVANENSFVENDNIDDPEYGLVVNKPIYTEGVNGSNRYLAGLKSELGEKLTWNRIGSTSAPGVNGIIDIYESTLPSGKPYKKLYLNMYGSSNSIIIPKGFSR